VLAESCVTLLQNARPLYSIFGPYYKPEILTEQRGCSRPLSPIRSTASSSLIGIRMESRRHYSNAHVREELMKMYHVRLALSAFLRTGRVSNFVGHLRRLPRAERYVRCVDEQ
jgi:hypothetical protein